MMSFKEHMDESEVLEEGVIRKGLGLVYGRQSKTHGDSAKQHFDRVKTRHTPVRVGEDLDDRLLRIEKSLIDFAEGMVDIRKQIGSLVSMVNVVILLNERNDKEIKQLLRKR